LRALQTLVVAAAAPQSCAAQALRDVLNRVLLDGGHGRVFSPDCPAAISDDLALIKNFFSAVRLPAVVCAAGLTAACRAWTPRGWRRSLSA
jgi:hypothetical protein